MNESFTQKHAAQNVWHFIFTDFLPNKVCSNFPLLPHLSLDILLNVQAPSVRKQSRLRPCSGNKLCAGRLLCHYEDPVTLKKFVPGSRIHSYWVSVKSMGLYDSTRVSLPGTPRRIRNKLSRPAHTRLTDLAMAREPHYAQVRSSSTRSKHIGVPTSSPARGMRGHFYPRHHSTCDFPSKSA